MKRSMLLVGIALLLVTVACSDRERSLTGDVGSKRVAGEIVLAQDLLGSTRDGIEVRVEGTGLSVVTGPDGRFDLFGAPESDVKLLFHRDRDGVDANVAVSGSQSSNLLIELGRHSARARSRGVGHPGVEVEGLIKEITDTTMTVTDGTGTDRVVNLTDTTIYRKGNTTLTLADFAVGNRVHVKALWNSDNTMTAVEVKLQEDEGDDDGGNDQAKVEIEGTVVSVDGTTLTVFDSHHQTDTILTDANTVIRKGNTTVLLTDLRQGDRVHVRATKADDGTLTATLIIVQNTNENVEYNGTVTAVGDGTLTFTTNQNQTVTVAVDSSTKIRKGSMTIQLSDIVVGDRVEVKAKKSSTGLTALEIHVQSSNGD